MGNTISFINENTEKLNTFEVKTIPSFEIIQKDILEKGKDIDNKYLDDLFERCCFINILDFKEDRFQDITTSKCCTHTPWFFRCFDCSINPTSCYCSICFLSNPKHLQENHKFMLFEGRSAICDCGFSVYVKESSFCPTHRNCNDQHRMTEYNNLPSFLKSDVHLFYRYLLVFLMNNLNGITTEAKYTTYIGSHEWIKKIIEWVKDSIFQSSLLIHILGEEILSESLENFNIKSPLIGYPLEIPVDTQEITATKQKIAKSSNFLNFLFGVHTSTGFIGQMSVVFTILLENDERFRIRFFSVFLDNYYTLFIPRDSKSSNTLTFIHQYLIANSEQLIPFATRPGKFNIIEVILSCHKLFMPILEPFYRTVGYKKEVYLQSGFETIRALLKQDEILNYFLESDNLFKELFEAAYELQRLHSPEFVNLSSSTTKFLCSFEKEIIILVKSILRAVTKNKNGNIRMSRDETIKKFLDYSIDYIKKLKFPVLNERYGVKLPLDKFVKREHIDLYIHAPLFRIIGSILVDNAEYCNYVLDKLTVEDVVNMISNTMQFRLLYITYDIDDPNVTGQQDYFITDLTLVADSFLLKFALLKMTPSHYLYLFFETLTGLKFTNMSSSFFEVFSMFCSIFQSNIHMKPTDDELRYHMVQCILSGKFETPERFGDLNRIYINKYKKIIKLLQDMTIGYNTTQLKKEYLHLYDPNYRFYSFKHMAALRNGAKYGYNLLKSKTPIDLKVNHAIPPPPNCGTLPKELNKVIDIFNSNDSMMMGIIFFMLAHVDHNKQSVQPIDMGDLVPNHLQTLIKQVMNPESLTIEVIYLLTIASQYFKFSVLPNLSSKDKDEVPLLFKNFYENIKKYDKEEEEKKFEKNEDEVEEKEVKDENEGEEKLKEKGVKDEIEENEVEEKEVRDENEGEEKAEEKGVKDEIEEKVNVTVPKDLSFIYHILNSYKVSYDNNTSYRSIMIILIKIYNTSVIKPVSELIEFIFGLFIEIEPSFVDFLKSYNISINEKPLSNNNNININNNNNNNIEIEVNEPIIPKTIIDKNIKCSCCGKDDSEQELLKISYIENSNLPLIQQWLNEIKEKKLGSSKYLAFLNQFHHNEITPGVLQYLPDRLDYPQLYVLYLFNRSRSTYITTCGHYVHEKCLSNTYQNGFKCGICKERANLLIPQKGTHNTDPHDSYESFYQSLCVYDFHAFVKNNDAKSFSVLERYLWKFVLKNIEILEIKSRKLNYLSTSPDQTYYAIEQVQFNKELVDLLTLYQSIMKCNFIYHGQLPINDVLIYISDAFTAASYTHYLTKSNPSDYLNKLFRIEVFKIMFLHIIKTFGEEISFGHMKAGIESIQKDLSTTGEKKLLPHFQDMIMPLLRKVAIFRFLYDNKDSNQTYNANQCLVGDLDKPWDITIEQFNDYEYLSTYFNHNIATFIQNVDWVPLANEYLTISSTPKGNPVYGIYPPPVPLSFTPRFINIPNKFTDLLSQTISESYKRWCLGCKGILKYMCLICGEKLCTKQCKNSTYEHFKTCQSLPLSILYPLSSPIIEVLVEKYRKMVVSKFTAHFSIFVDPNNQDFNTSTYFYPQHVNPSLVLSKENLKKVYKSYINSSNFNL